MRNSSRRAGYASRIDRHCPPRTTAIISAAIALAILMTTVGEAAAQSDTTSFVTTWRTDTANQAVAIPLEGSSMTVSWGDGQTDTGGSGTFSHTYTTPGDHTVSVSGGLTRIHLNGHADAPKLISIDQWGNASWTNMRGAFFGATNMVYKATDAPDLSRVINMFQMFTGASSFNGNITNWNTSSVIHMSSMFSGATAFNGNITNWDTSRVTSMGDVFRNAQAFNQPLDWDTSRVTSMSSMFSGATAFNGNITNWDTSRVTSMSHMFSRATAFNGNITDWDTSRVTDMISMFNSASSFNQPLDWNTSRVASMNRMFDRATAFNGNITDWDTSRVTDMNYMFLASSFNGNITNWDTSKVTSMIGMFFLASSFNQPISTWNVSSVTSMSGVFNSATSFNQTLDWDTSKVADMSVMFYRASSFNQPLDWDTSKVTRMSEMFAGASSFNGNITDWDTSNVTSMSHMFNGASSFNDNIADWDTSKVTSMSHMFNGASSFNDNIADWDTSKVTRMNNMFAGASSFNGTITDWDTSKVTHMNNMFAGASSFDQPLGSWDVSSAFDMSDMFNGADAFDQNLGAWYIMLDKTAIDRTDIPGTVGQISSQNRFLNDQGPAYDPVSNIDSTRFAIDSNLLKMTSITPAKATYIVNITATGPNVFESDNNWRAFEVTVNGDVVLPAPTLSTDAASPTNAASVTVTVDFGEPIDAATFTLDDISVTGGIASGLAQDGPTTQKYTFTVTPSSDGQLTVTIPADSVKDLAGNNNTASGQLPVTFDRTTPGPTLSTDAASPTNAASVTVTVDFGEPIDAATFTLDDISVTGGIASGLAQDGPTTQKYTFTVTPSSDGQLTVTIPADSVKDLAGNNNTASGQLPVTFDRTTPGPTLSTDAASPTNAASVTVTVDFGEPIDAATFTLDDISATGGIASGLAQDGPTTQKYTFTVTPSSDGQLTVTIPADSVKDPAGNNNTASGQLPVTFDRTTPGPTLSTDAASPTNAASVTVTVDFGEPIDAATFTLDDISVTGGIASGLAQDGPTTQKYTFTVTPSSDGQLTVTIPADSVKDPAGNNNTVSNVLRVTFDRTTHVPALSTDAASPTNAASVTVAVDFGEPIDDATFTLDDISVTGGIASGLAQEGVTTQKYTFTVTPSSDGQVTVTIPADSVKDPAGNNNTASGQLPVTFDRTTPGPTLSTDAASPTNAASVTVTVDFGEPIDDATFTLDDISVTGGIASGLAQDGPTTQKYTFTVTPSSDGQLTVTIPADSVKDPAGNNNTVSNVLRVTFDRTTHVPALSTDAASPTNAASVTVAVDFGEPIDDATFTLDDISVTGGIASGLAQEGVTTQKYTFTVTPSSDGQVTVTIPADSVKDPAGNSNTVSNVLRVTFDRTTHVPALSTDAASPTNAASVTVAVDFGEPIDDATFTLDDISVTGGIASGLAQEGVTTQKYTFTVTPSSDGQVTVTVPADRVTDPAGNSNTVSNVLRVTFDRTTPGPTLSTDAASPTNAASVTVAVDFGEPIDDATFTLDDISVTGGIASGLAQEGVTTQKYTFTVTPSSDGQVTVTVPADRVKDPAGNSNTASNPLSVTFDRVAFSPALSTSAASPTNSASATITVDFGEPIDDATFTLDDISVTGGIASGLAQDGPTTQKYTFTVTPSSDGQLTVTIPADSVKDPAGNNNTASGQLPVTFDRTTPVPALSTDAASPTNAASVTVAVDFGEPIDAATFTLDDISVTGGDASGLAQEGATTQKYTFTVTPSSDGQLTVTIPADSVKDPAGNNNTASGQLPVTFDRTTPGPTLSTDAASPTNAASVTVTVDFGEPIDDATFTLDDISVTGGIASGLAQDGPTTQKYTFTVTPSSDGQLTVTIPADSVKDPAGNNNTASGQLPVTFDRTSPAPSLATDTPSLTNATSVTVDFGEAIDASTFAISDVSVTGGNATSLAHSSANQTFTFTLMPDGDGEGDVTAVIPAGSVTDPAGNDNTASNILSVTLKPNVGCLEYVSYPNNPPVVDVGGSITVAEGETGTLRATVTDMDGDDVETIWFHWSLDNAIITIADPESLVTEFTAPYVDSDTVTYATLYACDGIHTGVGNDVVRITITDIPEPPEPPTPPQLPPPVQESAHNEPPFADAGTDFTINEGATGQLFGTATDPDNDPLTMEWYQTPTWPPLTLTDASDPSTAIVAPQVDGDTTITLILSVSDDDYTVTDRIQITITDIPEPQRSSESTTPPQPPPPVQESAHNMPPTADAGADFTINEGATGQLQGMATDSDNDPLTMEWYQTPTWPPLTLTNASDPSTTIVAPQVDGDTTITLILSVSDGDYTVTDQVRITITDIPEPQGSSESTTPPQPPPPVQEPAHNMPPTADAGADFTINEGATGQLQGMATDSDNDPLTMEWYQTPTWPPLTLTNASDPSTTIVAPQVDGDTTITLILSVSDDDYTVNDQVRITIIDTG